MTVFRKFSSIVQFANVVKHVRDHCSYHSLPLPKLNFSGSAKIHGTNAAIGFSPSNEVWFQSRERILSYEADNAGFYSWGQYNAVVLKEFYNTIAKSCNIEHDSFYIYGEWFGASIQKGVAVSQILEKKFGIFKMVFVKGEVETVIDPVNWHGFINAKLPVVFAIDYAVKPHTIEIDFSEPHLVQNRLLELTLAVEEECPIGKYFGVSGIGEGIVWATTDLDNIPKFKTKGSAHSVSKVTTVRELTDSEIASKANADEFVESYCTVNRMEQGITKLGEMGLLVDIKNMGAYLRWIGNDILTECHDVLVVSFIERKDVMPRISDKARDWFLNYLNSEVGLNVPIIVIETNNVVIKEEKVVKKVRKTKVATV